MGLWSPPNHLYTHITVLAPVHAPRLRASMEWFKSSISSDAWTTEVKSTVERATSSKVPSHKLFGF